MAWIADDEQRDLKISNLPYTLSDRDVFLLLTRYGTCLRVRLAHDRQSERPLGYGFARMSTPAEQLRVLQALNAPLVVQGRRLKAEPVTLRRSCLPKEDTQQ